MRAAVAVGAALGLGVVAGAVLVGRRAADERRAVRESHSVVEAVSRVTKLATVESSVSNWQLRRDSRELFGFLPVRCEKTLAVFYRGKVAAGFDVGPSGAVAVEVERGGTRRVRVRLPPPRILYVDVPPPELVVADGSVCNRVTPDDVTRLHADARTAVERDALAGGLLARAESHARELVQEIVRPLGFEAEVSVGAPVAEGTR
jgi:hypothetical protein